jgi:ankyrin repeat protein
MGKIHNAVEKGSLATVRRLLSENPACLHETLTDTRDQPLHLAAWQNHTLIVQLLIEAGAGINARGDRGWSPLHYAAYHGSAVSAGILCDAGADINQKDDAGWTPLLYASRGRNTESEAVARLLLDRDCEADLNSLISLSEIERVKEMLRRDANAVQNALIPNDLITDAAILVESEMMGVMFESSEDEQPQQRQQIIEKYRSLFTALVDAGVDINVIGMYQMSALAYVKLNAGQQPELVQFLVELGAR